MKKVKKFNYRGQPDRYGHFDLYGGTYVSETLVYPLQELFKSYKNIVNNAVFQKELKFSM